MPSMDDKSTIYSKACDAFSRKDYEEALELFTELNGWLDSKEKAQACQIRIANPDYDNIIRQQQEKSMQFSQSVEKHHIKINKKLLAYIGAGIAGCVLLSIIIIAATSLLKKPVNVMSTSTEVSSNNIMFRTAKTRLIQILIQILIHMFPSNCKLKIVI